MCHIPSYRDVYTGCAVKSDQRFRFGGSESSHYEVSHQLFTGGFRSCSVSLPRLFY